MAKKVSGTASDGTSSPPESRIVTFYSYKGGVGRTMALANVGLLLARDYCKRVIVVDWDLEAPGLHRFFGLHDEEIERGVIEYLIGYKALMRDPKSTLHASDISIKPYLTTIDSFSNGGSLRMLAAGGQRNKGRYAEQVRAFDWDNFYKDWNGGQVIEALRAELKQLAEIILIDSRTGVSDAGGVCTVQLPDTVVFVFVFNGQNLSGIEQVARELTNVENPAIKALGRRPDMLFLPSRKELSEVARLREWEGRAADRLERFCNTPAIRNFYRDVPTYLRKVSIPYVPYFAYGEELAAQSEEGYEMSEAFQPLISLLLQIDIRERRLPSTMQRIELLNGIFRYIGGSITVVVAGAYLFLASRATVMGSSFSFLAAPAFTASIGGALGGLLSSLSTSLWGRTQQARGISIGLLSTELAVMAAIGAGIGFLASLIVTLQDTLSLIFYVGIGYSVCSTVQEGIESRLKGVFKIFNSL